MQSDVHLLKKTSGDYSKLETKKEAILVAAALLFTRYGYTKVSMDRIADTANVSKATIYKKLSCKEEVFRESVEFLAHRHCPSPPSLDLDGGARHVLRTLAVWLRETCLSPDFIEFCRLCLSQAPHFPDVARNGYSFTMVPLIAPCEGAFQQMREAGLLLLPDSQLAADSSLALL